jgi:hypothetical protein
MKTEWMPVLATHSFPQLTFCSPDIKTRSSEQSLAVNVSVSANKLLYFRRAFLCVKGVKIKKSHNDLKTALPSI